MVRDSKFSAVVQRLIDSPEEATSTIRADLATFEQQVVAEEPGHPMFNAALFQMGAIGFLLFAKGGERVKLETAAWVPKVPSFASLEAAATRRSPDGRLMAIASEDGALLHMLWAPVTEALEWNLPPAVRRAIDEGADRIALMAGVAIGEGPLDSAVRGFGLPDLERKVVSAVVRTGSSRAAATMLRLSYATVRTALAQAARRMGQPNMPAVVRTVVAAAFGIFPADAGGATLLSDMLQLTPRQAQIALLVGGGVSREQVADAVGASTSVVKKDLELIFASLGVASAAELARLIVEVQALSILARATDGAPGFLDPGIEPARYAIRPNGRESIGWSDYGPGSGRPVLVVHSNWACRAVPRELLRELQARGFRPISIDRPGFGATHLGSSTPEDPFSQAVDDALQILDQLRIDEICVVARAGTHFVQMLKARAPGRVGRVVLVAPTLPTSVSTRRVGIMGTMKEAFQSPRVTEIFFRVICAQLSLARIDQLTRALVKGTAADEALCEDPQFMRDRFRAVRPFASGNFLGGIYEQRIISHGGFAFPPLDVADWIVVQGDSDSHNSFEDVAAHWGRLLPGTPIVRVQGGGRFMTSSHPGLIAEQLPSAAVLAG
jgi:pimeloyl-ACP methyl ester carboxylesterase/DNA-binding CsgD family transcriptional regulator